MLHLLHLTKVFSFVWLCTVGTIKHIFLIAFCLFLCFSPSPSDQAAVYKNMQERNGGNSVSHCLKHITKLLCKTISILTSTPKTVDAFQISYHIPV